MASLRLDLVLEPISPELALVCPELRATAVAALDDEPPAPVPLPVTRLLSIVPEPEPEAAPPVLLQIAVYVVWQMLMSALTAFAAVATVGISVLAIGFIGH